MQQGYEPLGSYDLCGSACVFAEYPKVPVEYHGKHCLEICAPRYSLYLYADTIEEIRDWARAVQRIAIHASVSFAESIRKSRNSGYQAVTHASQPTTGSEAQLVSTTVTTTEQSLDDHKHRDHTHSQSDDENQEQVALLHCDAVAPFLSSIRENDSANDNDNTNINDNDNDDDNDNYDTS
jgi:hypothetical protein